MLQTRLYKAKSRPIEEEGVRELLWPSDTGPKTVEGGLLFHRSNRKTIGGRMLYITCGTKTFSEKIIFSA